MNRWFKGIFEKSLKYQKVDGENIEYLRNILEKFLDNIFGQQPVLFNAIIEKFTQLNLMENSTPQRIYSV